ncbi:hypothetical protein LO763_22385 [Glycomyces sp. A-F 0318]|uniref:DUF7715 family protein n=1 Tax=Glycomyces amatae TaxID=2881355 RepID=UPI001E4464CD|nr:hypothetical protein [Glycomyces amatae]MCD0446367.1 hypothetical protein [Glycomyces amatae]
MRVLTATSRTQGQRDNDYHWCVEGELVFAAPFVCDADAADPNGGCGCGRGFAGLSSMKATTTAQVRDLDVTEAGVDVAVRSYLAQAGWAAQMTEGDLAASVTVTIAAAGWFPAGTVVERRLDDVRVRM